MRGEPKVTSSHLQRTAIPFWQRRLSGEEFMMAKTKPSWPSVTGPLAQYADGFRAGLARLGYTPLTAGPAVLPRTRWLPRPAARRPPHRNGAGPIPRFSCHPPGAFAYEASVKGSRRSPARPSPHLWPPDNSGALGLSPGLRTHAELRG